MENENENKNIIINNKIAECAASLATLVGETIKSLYSEIEEKINTKNQEKIDEITVFIII